MNLPISVDEARRLYEENDSAHAFDHVLRVYRLAQRIGRAEGADLRVLLTAALLHDIAREEPNHHLRGAERARQLLAEYDSAFVDAVVHCIEAHRFRKGPKPRTLEARILQDADKLDAIGAIGVARAFAHAGHYGEPLWAPLEEVKRSELDNTSHTPVHEYWHKLRHLAERLHTPTARAIARERHAFMEAFFRRLDEECRGER